MRATAVDLVRANSAAFSRRDVDAMLDLFADDALVVDRRAVGWGEFRGHDALRSYYQGLFDNADSLRADLEVVAEDGVTVIAACSVRAVLTGQPAADEVSFGYALRIVVGRGLIEAIEIYEDADAALAADSGAAGEAAGEPDGRQGGDSPRGGS